MLADILAFIGLISLLTGVYLWLGLPATLITLGIFLIFTAVQLSRTGGNYEPDTTPNNNP